MSDRERQISYDFTYVWNLKTKQMNKQKENRLIDTENKQVVPRGVGWGEIGEGN